MPSIDRFRELSRQYNFIPVWKELAMDVDTTVSLFLKTGDQKYAFLLESLEGGEKWGRYSFIGIDPMAVFRSKGRDVSIDQAGETRRFEAVNPIDTLRQFMKGFRQAPLQELPRFYGGAVGFFGYDMVRFMEKLPVKLEDRMGFSDSHFIIPGTLIICDNLRQSLIILVNSYLPENVSEDGLSACFERAVERIETVRMSIEQASSALVYQRGAFEPETQLAPEVSQPEFERMVDAAKEYIRAGDIIQVVLSQRFSGKNSIPPFELYRTLRRINPSPYLYYLKMDDEYLIGSSPEILVRLTDDKIELRPIAGTRPRGKDRAEDIALSEELLGDEKERAEHLMLVDLGRNDVGRVARIGSVKVDELMVIERYSHVMHIVSHVTGVLEHGKDMFDVLNACFPAGTVSGAPKIRAMQIIEGLEHARRGPYAGAVGYLGFGGNMDMAITIRTLFQKGDTLYLQAGAGIVADSVPEKEWDETLNKGRAMMRTVQMCQKGV